MFRQLQFSHGPSSWVLPGTPWAFRALLSTYPGSAIPGPCLNSDTQPGSLHNHCLYQVSSDCMCKYLLNLQTQFVFCVCLGPRLLGLCSESFWRRSDHSNDRLVIWSMRLRCFTYWKKRNTNVPIESFAKWVLSKVLSEIQRSTLFQFLKYCFRYETFFVCFNRYNET